MDSLKYLSLIMIYLLVYSMLNAPHTYYSWALGEGSTFASNLWLILAVVKLAITYVFLKKINVDIVAVLIVLLTASIARLALSLPFSAVVIGYVMHFTNWLTIPLKELRTQQ